MTTEQREIAVMLRALLHMAWVLGIASAVAWLSPRAEFVPTLIAVVLGHSAWRAAEMETDRC